MSVRVCLYLIRFPSVGFEDTNNLGKEGGGGKAEPNNLTDVLCSNV